MRVISIILLTFSFTSLSGQPIQFIGTKFHYGNIIAHDQELEGISSSNPFGIQAEISWLKTGDKAWKTCNCYGKTGISFAYFNYQNREQLGSSFNLMYFAEPYLTYKGNSKLSLRSAFGVSYLDRVYDINTNPENIFFSTPISFYLMLGLTYNYHINDKYALNTSLNYNHISNGGQRQPNKGMNFPTFSLGIDHIINYSELIPKTEELKVFDPALTYYVTLFSSLRSADETSESSDHLRIGVLGGIVKPLSSISGVTAGVEIGYDDSYQTNIEKRSLDESPIVSSFLLGHRFQFGRVSFFTHLAGYISRPRTLQEEWFYQNYVLSYRFSSHLAIGTGLIAYGRVADHMDFRLTWIP